MDQEDAGGPTAGYAGKITILKEMMATEKDLHCVATYFFDQLGADHRFIARSKPTKHKRLKAILQAVSANAFGKDCAVTHVRLMKIGSEALIHGNCSINGKAGTVMFFEDINIGLLIILMSLQTHETSCIRFTPTVIEGDKMAFFMGSETISIH
jgi:hypothetical protein